MENYVNNIQDKRIEKIERHTETMNKEFGELLVKNGKEHSEMKTDLLWLKKGYWVVATASVGAVAGAVINILK